MRVYQIKVLIEAQHSSALMKVTIKAWSSTVKLQFSRLDWSAAKGPLFWSCRLFLDFFMYYFLKMVKKSPVKWTYPIFLESAKLEFHFYCNY